VSRVANPWPFDLQTPRRLAIGDTAGWQPALRNSGSWRASTPIPARIGTLKRDWLVAQAFEPAGSGDFPVARSWSTGLESPVNPQAGKPALQAGSWVVTEQVGLRPVPHRVRRAMQRRVNVAIG